MVPALLLWPIRITGPVAALLLWWPVLTSALLRLARLLWLTALLLRLLLWRAGLALLLPGLTLLLWAVAALFGTGLLALGLLPLLARLMCLLWLLRLTALLFLFFFALSGALQAAQAYMPNHIYKLGFGLFYLGAYYFHGLQVVGHLPLCIHGLYFAHAAQGKRVLLVALW